MKKEKQNRNDEFNDEINDGERLRVEGLVRRLTEEMYGANPEDSDSMGIGMFKRDNGLPFMVLVSTQTSEAMVFPVTVGLRLANSIIEQVTRSMGGGPAPEVHETIIKEDETEAKAH